MPRVHRLAPVAVVAAALSAAACGDGRNPTDARGDVIDPFGDLGCVVNCDAAPPEAGDVDAGDGGGTLDAADATGTDGDATAGDAQADATDAGEGGVVMGRCVPVGSPLQVVNERRSQGRPVYVARSGATGFIASTVTQAGGLDNVFATRVGADGARVGDTNVSGEVGALVEGGAIAPDGAGNVVVYSSNGGGPLDVFARRIDAAGVPSGAAVRVSNDTPLSEGAQVAQFAGGWMVVWRSRDDRAGTTQLLASVLSTPGFTASAPVAVTPVGMVPGSFDLAADGARVAVTFVNAMTTAANVHVVQLASNGAPMGTPVALTTGSIVSDAVASALRGDDLLVAWAEVRPEGTLHLRRVNLASGTPGPLRVVPEVGGQISKPALALDGATGYVVAFRAPMMADGSVAIARLSATLAITEGVSRVGRATTGDVVRVAAQTNGTYLVGWADESAMMTTGTVQVMRCP